jgi:hypothetical protein
MWEYNHKALEKIPGINFNNKRTQIVACFEEQLRHDFIIRSHRLLNELNTFVYINGKPNHMKGAHDDGIMSMAIAMYVGDISFTQLKRNEQQNKAMLESWVMSERTYEAPQNSVYSYGTSFDQVGMMQIDSSPYAKSSTTNTPAKEQYSQYSWLFGSKKRVD